MGLGEQRHNLGKDICAIIGITFKFLGRNGWGWVGWLSIVLHCSLGPGTCKGNVGDIRAPRAQPHSLLCSVFVACRVSLGDVNEDEGVISWCATAENNKCLFINRRKNSFFLDYYQGGQLWIKPPHPICTTILIHRATLITVHLFYCNNCVLLLKVK